jgi:flagella basal body P-ring formation protein FlgA
MMIPNRPRLSRARLLLLSLAVGLAATSGARAADESGDGADAASPQAIASVAETFVRGQLRNIPGATGQPTIRIETPRSAKLAACDQMMASFPSGARLRSRVSVTVRCVAPRNWTTYVQANISVPVRYYVAAHALTLGQTLTAQDLEARDGDFASLPSGAVTDPASLIGMQVSYRINAGSPVPARSLRSAASVTRGQKVRIVARGNGFVVTNEGEAMGTAAPGAPVQVRTASGQTLTAIVRGPGEVEIPL